MKLERYFKYFCFAIATFLLFTIYLSISAGDTQVDRYLTKIGLLFISIEYGVLMTSDELKKKVTLKSLIVPEHEKIEVTGIGVFAYVLGKIGFIFIVIGFVMSFIK